MNNECLDDAIGKIERLAEDWEAGERDKDNALKLQMRLSVMKLMIGINTFDELPAFSRLLREVTDFINADEKEKRLRIKLDRKN